MSISFSRFYQNAVAGTIMAGLMAASQAQEVGSRWILHVFDLNHATKVEATIRFTSDTAAESCMAGDWNRVVVETKTVQDEGFFPLAELLAYKLNRGDVTLGRTKICDGYLFLTGKSDDSDIQGAFNAVSIKGSQKLGYFSLTRVR